MITGLRLCRCATAVAMSTAHVRASSWLYGELWGCAMTLYTCCCREPPCRTQDRRHAWGRKQQQGRLTLWDNACMRPLAGAGSTDTLGQRVAEGGEGVRVRQWDMEWQCVPQQKWGIAIIAVTPELCSMHVCMHA